MRRFGSPSVLIPPFRPVRLSVVVPALNEADAVAHAVRSAFAAGTAEVIVVDGGSVDATKAAARQAGATVVDSPRGRSRQMNAGAEAATGDVLLFLHADTTLPEDAFVQVRSTVERGAEGGCFRLRFDADAPLLRLYAAATRLPIPWLVYGDRALWCTRAAFDAVGGFPDLPVFEDVAFVRALVRRRRFRFVPSSVTTSARRFLRDGLLRRQLRNALLTVAYWVGVPPERLARRYPSDERRG
ncbi:MAG: TIGR04283 family arsenosugar biosynthesis glycosyltransferase [Bacteroidetes bacterium]|nr:TIGR04283 family arsenosugar biosynthesis glycosyltransferase [Bacteroidota bacterium]